MNNQLITNEEAFSALLSYLGIAFFLTVAAILAVNVIFYYLGKKDRDEALEQFKEIRKDWEKKP